MYKVKFGIEDQSLVKESLYYIGHNLEALKEVKEMLLETEVSFFSNELSNAFRIISSSCNDKLPLEDIKVIDDLLQIKMYSFIEQGSDLNLSRVYFRHFLERLRQNEEKLEKELLINFIDSRDAFKAFVQGNLRALINSNNEYKFIHWNGRIWNMLTREEAELLYGDFIKKCRISIERLSSNVNNTKLKELKKKAHAWENDHNCNQCLNSIKRDRDRIINIKHYENNEKIICTSDGKLINLSTGEIRDVKRRDLILNTVKYKLKQREEVEEFMSDILKTYEYALDGIERLNFLNDFIAYKILGNGMQKAVFNIGKTGSGKSFFKNVVTELFINDSVAIPYTYFTTKHIGNSDVSRDDILVSLNNKKIALSSEPDKGDLISQARFKKILSNSKEKARETRGNLVDVNLHSLDLIIDTNDIPVFTEFNEAINKRLLFVRWTNKIPEEKANVNFYKTVVVPNFDYVFSFYIYRALDMINREIEIPEVILQDTLENTRELDSFVKFVNTYLKPCDHESYITVDKLYSNYNTFCDDKYLPNSIPDNCIKNEDTAKGFLIKKLRDIKEFSHIEPSRRTRNKTYILRGVSFRTSNINDLDN